METLVKDQAEIVDAELIRAILEPYKENCKYLKKVFVDPGSGPDGDDTASGVISARGEFAIPESCYIRDTGHFNSVEFNICYNQFVYVLLAYCVEHKLLDAMKDMDLETYKRRQLPDILIVEFASRFKKPVNSIYFYGKLTIRKVTVKRSIIFVKTECSFHDDNKGRSEGEVLLAIVDSGAKG